jgi:hypothetical protein
LRVEVPFVGISAQTKDPIEAAMRPIAGQLDVWYNYRGPSFSERSRVEIGK